MAPALIGGWASREQIDRERALVSRWVRVFGRLNEVLSGIVVVRSFVKEEDEKRRFAGGVSDASAIARRGVHRDAKVNASKNAMRAVARVTALGLGGVLVARHEISLGTLVAFVGYAGGVFLPVQSLTGMYQAVRKGSVALDRRLLDPRCRAPHSATRTTRTIASSLPRRRHLRRRELRLSGPVARSSTRCSSAVRAGVSESRSWGPSGAGKDPRSWRFSSVCTVPTAGPRAARRQGHPLLQAALLRSQIAVRACRRESCFDDTIRDNIAFGRPRLERPREIRGLRSCRAMRTTSS
ncbi:MAG: ABC transporter transmembrane domain-containing protein [Rhizomicrobium sp.]